MAVEGAGPASFPWAPVLCLCMSGFVTAFNQTMISPLVPFFVVDAGMVTDPREPGKYAGYLIASAQLGRMFTSIAWGRCSDQYGRKVVLAIGLLSTACTGLLFGCVLNFWLAVLIRFIGGAMDFTFGIVKTYIAEGIPEEHRSRAMSYTGATWGSALICGPAVGGLLANPAQQYPRTFSESGLFAQLPYLLPCLVTALLALLSLAVSMWTLQETVQAAIGKSKDRNEAESKGAHAADGDSIFLDQEGRPEETDALLGGTEHGKQHDLQLDDESPQTPRGKTSQFVRFFCERKPALALAYYCLLILIEFADEVLFSLFAAAPRLSGGLGFEASTTGRVMGACGVLVILTQVFVYARLERRCGSVNMLRICMLLNAFLTPLLPLASYPAGRTYETWRDWEGYWKWGWIAIGRVVRLVAVEFCFTASSIVSNNAITATERGSYIGLQQTVSCIGRMIGPLVAGPLFAWSLLNATGDADWDLSYFPFNHFFVFLILSAVSLICSFVAFAMPKSIQRPREMEADWS